MPDTSKYSEEKRVIIKSQGMLAKKSCWKLSANVPTRGLS